jgi:hypothetical protein
MKAPPGLWPAARRPGVSTRILTGREVRGVETDVEAARFLPFNFDHRTFSR